MRKHGKQAQLKDDEIDRIERAAKAACGPTREEVMNSMYNRLNPKPIGEMLLVSQGRHAMTVSIALASLLQMALIVLKSVGVRVVSDRKTFAD